MITIIRRKLIQNNAYKVVVWAMVIVCALSIGGPGLFKQSGLAGEWIASINGNAVGYNDFARKIVDHENRLSMLRRIYGSHADAQLQAQGMSTDPQRLALESLIREELINQIGQSMAISVHPQVAEEKLRDMAFIYEELSDLVPPHAVHPTAGIDMRILRDHLRRFNYSMTDFNERVEASVARSTVRYLVEGSSYVPAFEVREQWVHDFARKKFSVLTLPLDRFVKDELNKGCSASDLQTYYENNRERYRIAEKRSCTVWKFNPANYNLRVTDEEIKSYYDTHKIQQFVEKAGTVQVRRILLTATEQNVIAVRDQAEALRATLVASPAIFASKAQELSQDKDSAKEGGLLPAFARGTYEREFEKTAFLLKKDGDISSVIQTAQGFEILQRVRKTEPVYKSLEAVTASIRLELLQQKFADRFEKDVEGLAQDEKGWAQLVVAGKAQESSRTLITSDSSKLVQELFAMKQGETRSFVENGSGIAIRMTQRIESIIPALASIKGAVEKDYASDRAARSLARVMGEIKAELGAKSLEEAGKAYGFSLEHTQSVAKNDSGGLATIRAKKLPIDEMIAMEKKGLILTATTEQGGYIARLDDVAPFEDVQEETMSTLKASLEQENARFMPASFVASLYRNATIEHNELLLNKQKENSI